MKQNMEKESYGCNHITQGKLKFYSLTIPSEILAEIHMEMIVSV